MSTHEVALAQSENLAKISDENLVAFFERELRAIGEGQSATSVFNSSIIKSFTRFGILKTSTWRGRGSKYLVLTDKGRDLLESK